MTLYADDNAVIARAEKVAGKAAKKKARKWYVLSAAGVLLAGGGAAFAAVQLFGYGNVDQGAATMKNLTVANAKLTGSLVPGQSVGGSADVTNDNDFPVTVTAIILQDSSLQTSGTGCDPGTVTPGGSVAAYPTGGNGHRIPLSSTVSIPANSAGNISVKNVVSQAASATALCGVKATFAVAAQVGTN